MALGASRLSGQFVPLFQQIAGVVSQHSLKLLGGQPAPQPSA